MKFLPLIWAGLWRKPARTTMSLLSLVTAFLLFGLLRSVDAGFDTLIAAGQPDRLFISPRFFAAPMPVSYVDQIARIDGVAQVEYQFFARGYSRDPKILFFVGGASANMFNLYSELGATPAQIDTLKAKPNGLLITPAMATHLGGVKIGDHIPLHSDEVRQKNGSPDWDFELVGFIDRKEAPGIYAFSFGNYGFMNEARADPKNTVQQIAVRVSDRTRAVTVAAAIDAMFVNSGLPTRTVVDQVSRQSQVASLGNIKLITDGVLATVLFVLLLLTVATVTQSVDERTGEFAVLKTLGFTDGGVFSLVLAEALLQCVTGAALGLAAASIVSPLMQGRMLGPPVFFRIPASVFVLGLATAALVAVVATAFPGLRASRLQIAEALARR